MKKILFVMFAVVAMSVVSCKNGQTETCGTGVVADSDSVEVVDSTVVDSVLGAAVDSADFDI